MTSVFAIGDCIHGPMLAHKAEDEGFYYFAFVNFSQLSLLQVLFVLRIW